VYQEDLSINFKIKNLKFKTMTGTEKNDIFNEQEKNHVFNETEKNDIFNKENFLTLLNRALVAGWVSKSEVLDIVNNYSRKRSGSISFMKILSVLGSIISILGIVFFVSQIWNSLGDAGQILITLGLGLLFFVVGILLMLEKAPRFVSLSLHLIGAFLIPFGTFVSLSKLPPVDTSIALISSLVFLSLAMLYFIVDYFLKSNLFTVAVYIFGSISYCSFIFWIGSKNSLDYRHVWALFAVYGYILTIIPRILEPGFRKQTYKFFEGLGYLTLFTSIFGILFETPLEILVIFIYILGIFLGSKIKSSQLIAYSFIAVTAYILRINSAYFIGIIGWPLGLVLSGLILILSGLLFSKFNKKV
jgi:MFS family permease